MLKSSYQIPQEDIVNQAKIDGIDYLVVGLSIFKADKLLVVRRNKDDFLGGFYEIPGGKVEEGETLEEAILRETAEETGLKVKEILNLNGGFEYRHHDSNVRQVNFSIEVEAGEVILSPEEHDQYRWIARNEVEELNFTPEMKKNILEIFNQKV